MKRIILLLCLLLPLTVPAQPQTLTLKNADILTLISTVSELTGKNFIVDPRVKGKVTVISAQPMESDELYAVFLSVLRVHGFSAVASGDVIRIQPDSVSIKDALPVGESGDGPDALVTRVIALKHVGAAEMANVLRPMLSASGQIATHSGSNTLIVSERQGALKRLLTILKRIDQDSDDTLEIIPLQHASAEELLRTLKLFTEKEGNGPGLKMLADGRSNTLILSGPKERRLKVRAIVAHLDTPLGDDGNTQVIYLNYARATDLVPILEGMLSKTAQAQGKKEAAGNSRIFAHADTNALVISASPAEIRALEPVIHKLDIPRAQVLVEAVIAEISEEKANELGVQWQLASNLSETGAIGGTNFGNDGGNILNASINPAGVGPGLNIGYLNGQVTLPGSDTPILQLGALVKALASDSNSNILSTPNLVALDNEEANIQVGQEVPFVTGQFTNTGANQSAVNPFQTIKRQDVGLKLTFTPHVNEGDAVIMEIQQEISSLANSVGAVDLVTNKRTLNTTVRVPDGQILVLGGLITDDVQDTVSRVPVLGRIPLLGNLFRHRKKQHVRRNLMVFLRPTILKDQRIMNQVTRGKYQLLKDRKLLQTFDLQQPGMQEAHPLLPALDALPGAQEPDE